MPTNPKPPNPNERVMRLNKKHRREMTETRNGANEMLRKNVLSRVGNVNVSYVAGRNYVWRERRVFPEVLGSTVLAVVALTKALEYAVVTETESV